MLSPKEATSDRAVSTSLGILRHLKTVFFLVATIFFLRCSSLYFSIRSIIPSGKILVEEWLRNMKQY